MVRLLFPALAALALAACSSEAPPPPPGDTITPALETLAEKAKPGTLGVLMLDLQTGEARGVNIDKPLPMQSVFKLPLGIVVLDAVDKGQLKLDTVVTLTEADLAPAYSPIAEAFPEKRDYRIEELLRASVAQSDNTAADVLLKLVGGPEVVTRFFRTRGIATFRLDRYERELQPQSVGLPPLTAPLVGLDAFIDAQNALPVEAQNAALRLYLADPRDRLSPRGAVEILALLDRGKLLSPAATTLMRSILRSTTTGTARLKGGAPKGAAVFHKTGTGLSVEKVNSATNDIGIIALPDGRKLAVAVFLSGSELPSAERDAMIAEVARLATTKLVRAASVP